MNTEHLPKGVTIILYRKRRFAVSQRIGKAKAPGFWQFAGGHVEHGEEPIAAAQRELREETGLDLHAERFFHIGTTGPLTGYNGETYIGFRFGVTLDDSEEPAHTEPEKHTPWTWVSWHDLLQLQMLQQTVPYGLAYALRQETLY